jgi:hypothetical protein
MKIQGSGIPWELLNIERPIRFPIVTRLILTVTSATGAANAKCPTYFFPSNMHMSLLE